jgi:hypothetical protein
MCSKPTVDKKVLVKDKGIMGDSSLLLMAAMKLSALFRPWWVAL